MSAVDIARLMQICERSLEAVGYEVVEVEYVRDGGGWVLRVYIDHPAVEGAGEPGGPPPASRITLEDCAQASRHLGTVLDVEDVIPSAYRLELSSPGVRRPLRKERDFARFVGQTVRLQLSEPWEGQRNFVGILRSAGAGQVGIELEGRQLQLPLEQIKRARLEIDLGS